MLARVCFWFNRCTYDRAQLLNELMLTFISVASCLFCFVRLDGFLGRAAAVPREPRRFSATLTCWKRRWSTVRFGY